MLFICKMKKKGVKKQKIRIFEQSVQFLLNFRNKATKKQNFSHLKEYEAKKKFIVDLFETDRIIKIKHVSIKSIFNVISSVENPDLDLRSECYLKLQ